ncbi:MAG: tyrosine-type recombinase/integrase, partial [Betaproteobacteria bacterium]|nr:tyrosine-type recombinase/integrase [Betaproteobacteria bacterium]
YKLYDRDGLYLYVTPRSARHPKGAKSWRFDYRLNGKRETLVIGRYPEISLDQARTGKRTATFISLADARSMVAKGESPAAAKQEKKAEAQIARANTLRAIGEKWYAAKAPHRSSSWQDNAKRWLDKDLYPALGGKAIKDITHDQLEAVLRKIAEQRGAKSAHYARLMVASIYNDVPRVLKVGNPARDLAGFIHLPTGVPKGKPLTVKGIPAFLEAADRYAGRPQTKLAIRLLFLTFTRKRELVEAPWDEIDVNSGEWAISAARMKGNKPHIVPLSRQAVEAFTKLKELAGSSRYVFPNLGDPRKPMSASTLNDAFNTIGYGGKFTPHGVRSTASTVLNGQGWSADAIERQLAHTERDQVRAAYNHSDFMEERRKMMQSWADYLDGLSAGADVVPIRGKAA